MAATCSILLVLCTACGSGASEETRTVDLSTLPKRELPADPPPPMTWQDLLERMQVADREQDPVRRCLTYPDPPGVGWSTSLVKAACGLVEPPRYGLAEIASMTETDAGRQSLERHFDGLLREARSNPGGREPVYAAFVIFDQSLASQETAARWVALAPQSPYARLAHGRMLLAVSAAVRGDKVSALTLPANLEQGGDLAEEAATELEALSRERPELVPACAFAAVAMRRSRSAGEAFDFAADCVRRHPASYRTLMAWKATAEPRWGGSEEWLAKVGEHAKTRRAKEPLMGLVVASVQAEPVVQKCCNFDDADLGALEAAVAVAPDVATLHALANYWLRRKDIGRALTYLSEAIRFSADSVPGRDQRLQINRERNPEWAMIDADRLVGLLPGSVMYRQERKIVGDNLQAGSGAQFARTGRFRITDTAGEIKAAFMDHCERYSLLPRPASSDPMQTCSASIVQRWPDDPEAWRLHADVLHYRHQPAALDAAKRYLALAHEGDPEYDRRSARYRSWEATLDAEAVSKP